MRDDRCTRLITSCISTETQGDCKGDFGYSTLRGDVSVVYLRKIR